MNFSQFCVLGALLTLAALAVPLARTSAEQMGAFHGIGRSPSSIRTSWTQAAMGPTAAQSASRKEKCPLASYGIECPLLVCTDCTSGLSTVPLRLISSRKLLAVTGWPLSA